jgi:hypothetical protein
MKRREHAKLHALDEDQSEVQRGEHDDGDNDVLQSNVKFASLKEQCSAARTNVVLRIVMSTITVVCLVSSLPLLFLRDDFASRHLHIQMLRNYYTVPTRCRHRGGIVDPLGCKACRTIRQPISPSTQIQDHSIQNHPKPVSFLSSGVSSESSLTPLNPTITHT